MRILLATDAWEPQVNGVVRTLTRVVAEPRAISAGRARMRMHASRCRSAA